MGGERTTRSSPARAVSKRLAERTASRQRPQKHTSTSDRNSEARLLVVRDRLRGLRLRSKTYPGCLGRIRARGDCRLLLDHLRVRLRLLKFLVVHLVEALEGLVDSESEVA